MPQYQNLRQAISDMRERGFTHTFTIQHSQIFCSEKSQSINPEQLTLLERHHIPDAHTGDHEIYGLRTDDNTLGLMTNTYAGYDPEEFNKLFARCRHIAARHS